MDAHIYHIAQRPGWMPKNASAEKTHETLEPFIPDRAQLRLHVNLIRHCHETCVAGEPHSRIAVLRIPSMPTS